MKNMKKILALVVAVLMIVASVSVAFAGDNDIIITIMNTTEKAHTYSAYQIFKGTVEEIDNQKVLTGIDWGNGVTNTSALLNALKTSTALKTGDAFDFADAITAQDVARILGTLSNNADKVKAFANIVEASYLGTAAATQALSGSEEERTAALNVTTAGAGYYLIKDTGDILEGEAATKFILQVVESKAVEAKDTHLTPDKKIVEGSARVDANNVAIGDDVTFEITVDIPDTTEYNNYKMVMKDTMSKGLTFKEITSIKILNDEMISTQDDATTDGKITAADLATELSATNYYASLASADNDAHLLTITFKDFKTKAETTDASGKTIAKTGKITITYVATLNEDAIIEGEGNPNTVTFDYTNNPNKDTEGDKITQNDPVGHTPDSTTITYVTELRVKKVDGTHNNTPLAGAEFQLTGNAINITLLTGTKYVATNTADTEYKDVVDEGPFYKLTDGTYTETSPTTQNIDTSKYVDSTGATTYKLVSYEEKILENTATDRTVWSGEDGIITFTGLKVGEDYTLTEVTAPTGFNKIEDIVFTVTWTKPAEGDTSGKGGFTIEAKSDDYEINWNETDKVWEITVQNFTGTTLPSTGGMGTTLLYVGGSILVLAAAILLITKRRMSSED